MVEVLLFVNIGLLVIGSVTLTIAVFVLQTVRGYVELAEERMERLREGQERLSSCFVQEDQRPAEQRDDEKIKHLEKEAEALREALKDLGHEKAGSSSHGTSREGSAKNIALLTEGKSGTSEPTGPARDASGAKESVVAVRHAHPDDDVSLRREGTKSTEREGSRGRPAKMFLEHYHRYLENYEGYVRLAERLYRMREDGEVPPGSPSEREWEEKLRRLNDGIRRTTARLDILEQYNPELVSDERVAHRAEISRSYVEIERRTLALESSYSGKQKP